MLILIASIFFFIILIFYSLLAGAVIYHLKHYNVSRSATRRLITVFLVVSLIFFILDLIFYILIPWKEVSQSIGNIFQLSFHL